MLKVFILSFSLLFLSGCITKPEPKTQTKSHTKVVKKEKIVKVAKTIKKNKVVKKVIAKVLKKKKAKSFKAPKSGKLFQTVSKKDAVILQKGEKRAYCVICGMDLAKYYKTNHAAKLNDKSVQYCSLHCLTEAIKNGAELVNPMVVDVKSLKFIPVTEAFYVVGSDVEGTMTPISKYAFKSIVDAKAFQKKHGGKILDFYSAWQIAKKDFKKK